MGQLGDGGRDRVALSVGDRRVGFCHAGASQPFPCRGGAGHLCWRYRTRIGVTFCSGIDVVRNGLGVVVFREGYHAPAMKEVVPGAREPCHSAHTRLKLLEALPSSHCAPCCECRATGGCPVTGWHVNLENPLHPPPNRHKKAPSRGADFSGGGGDCEIWEALKTGRWSDFPSNRRPYRGPREKKRGNERFRALTGMFGEGEGGFSRPP